MRIFHFPKRTNHSNQNVAKSNDDPTKSPRDVVVASDESVFGALVVVAAAADGNSKVAEPPARRGTAAPVPSLMRATKLKLICCNRSMRAGVR